MIGSASRRPRSRPGSTATSAPGFRRRATASGFSPAERGGADECARYLQNKHDYLEYPALLKAGWPVASGLIEGAARWLIKDRMEVTGARWSLDGAQAILRLRALVGNGDFDDYLKQENYETTTASTSSLEHSRPDNQTPELSYP